MKEVNYEVIRAEAEKQLLFEEWPILDELELDVAIMIVVGIYVSNNLVKAYAQDVLTGISIVSTRNRIAIVGNSTHSFYKTANPLCLYDDLGDDINNILIMLNAAFVRWSWNQEEK